LFILSVLSDIEAVIIVIILARWLTYPAPHLAALLYRSEVAFDEDIFGEGG
jgi:hypothetical protein